MENFFTTWAPSIDSASAQPFLPEPAYVMAKRGINIPLLIGYTKDEGISTVVKPYESDFCEINKDFAKHLARELRVEPDQVKNIAEPVRKYYFGQDPIKSSTKIKEYIKLKSDVIVINGIQEVVDYQLKKPTPTYLYRYSYIGSWDTYRTMMKCQVKGTSAFFVFSTIFFLLLCQFFFFFSFFVIFSNHLSRFIFIFSIIIIEEHCTRHRCLSQ